MQVTIIGAGQARHRCTWEVVLRRKLRRLEVVPFFANLPSCTVGAGRHAEARTTEHAG